MAGTFQTDRAIFGNPIWKNIIDFRLFFFLYGNALYKGSQKYNEVEVKRGQFLRSYRKLSVDLEYTEHNTIKQYSLHALKDSINRLIADGRIEAKETGIGTLFSIKNYNEYQIFSAEQGNTLGNSTGTAREQHGNNKKKDKKDKKEKNTTTIAPDKPDAGIGKVNWENCKTPQQKLAAYYLKQFSPDIYNGNQLQVSSWFKRHGKALTNICHQCGDDFEIIKKAFNLTVDFFNKNNCNWVPDTVAKHIGDFLSPAKREVEKNAITETQF